MPTPRAFIRRTQSGFVTQIRFPVETQNPLYDFRALMDCFPSNDRKLLGFVQVCKIGDFTQVGRDWVLSPTEA